MPPSYSALYSDAKTGRLAPYRNKGDWLMLLALGFPDSHQFADAGSVRHGVPKFGFFIATKVPLADFRLKSGRFLGPDTSSMP
jgi:hypothetical protein